MDINKFSPIIENQAGDLSTKYKWLFFLFSLKFLLTGFLMSVCMTFVSVSLYIYIYQAGVNDLLNI